MLLMTNLISPKKNWGFFLELPLDILEHVNPISSKNAGVNPAAERVIPQNNAGICRWKHRGFQRENRLKNLQIRCSMKEQITGACLSRVRSSKALGAWALIIKMWGLQAGEDHPGMVQKPACLKPRATWTRAPSDMIGVGRDFIIFLISVFPSVYLDTRQLN